MKVLLINPPSENTIASLMPKELEQGLDFLPPLGLMYLAAYLKKHSQHYVEILDCPVENCGYNQLELEIKKRKPDLVGITAMTFTLIDVLKTAQTAKRVNNDIKVVLGGPHVIIYPRETISRPEVDFLVLGEGEKPLKELLDLLASSSEKLDQVKNLVFKENGKIISNGLRPALANLDSLPFPDRLLLPYTKYFSVISPRHPVTTMFSSRGCPYQCLFCDRPALGKAFRARSAQNVVEEMEECQKIGIKEIFIYDDTFGVSRQRVLDICRRIQNKGLTIAWDVRTRVDTINEEIIRALKKANCQRIHYGVEAGTRKILNVLRKQITLEQIEKAFKITKKYRIETVGYFMLGSPTETKKDILQTIKLAKKLDPDFIHLSITTPFPATNLYALGLKQKTLKSDYWLEFAKNPSSNFIPPVWEENFTKNELLRLLKYGYRSFYFRPKYILRRLLRLNSWLELENKARAGWRLLKI